MILLLEYVKMNDCLKSYGFVNLINHWMLPFSVTKFLSSVTILFFLFSQ